MAETPPPALAGFDALIGTWDTVATHPMTDAVVPGTVTYEWLEGGRFVVERSRNDHELFPDAICVIGAPESGEGLVMEYFDSRGVRRTYDTSLEDGVLRIWRDADAFDQRLVVEIAPDDFEAVYVDEVEALSRSATEFAALEPWEALTSWLQRFVGYVATKQALAEELFAVAKDADRQAVFAGCRAMLHAAGEPLLRRAQDEGVVRADVTIEEVVRLVGGIAKIPADDPDDIRRVLDVALDGLRYRGA